MDKEELLEQQQSQLAQSVDKMRMIDFEKIPSNLMKRDRHTISSNRNNNNNNNNNNNKNNSNKKKNNKKNKNKSKQHNENNEDKAVTKHRIRSRSYIPQIGMEDYNMVSRASAAKIRSSLSRRSVIKRSRSQLVCVDGTDGITKQR